MAFKWRRDIIWFRFSGLSLTAVGVVIVEDKSGVRRPLGKTVESGERWSSMNMVAGKETRVVRAWMYSESTGSAGG